MIKIRIINYSLEIADIFKQEQTYLIDSAFNHTVNLTNEKSFISLVDKNSVLVPMGVRVSVLNFNDLLKKIEVNQEVIINSQGIFFKDFSFLKEDASFVSLGFPAFRRDQSLDDLNQLRVEINRTLNKYGQGQLLSAYRKTTKEADKLITLLEKTFYQKLTQLNTSKKKISLLANLIGLGEGLTPSGDDFVLGVLSLWFYLKNKSEISPLLKELIKQVLLRKDGTTKVSRAFLDYGSRGIFNETVIQLFHNHFNGENYQKELKEISQLGHSSGSDFLLGIIYGLNIGGIN